MDFIYYIFKDFVHYSALILLIAIIPFLVFCFAKPNLLNRRFRVFSNRQNIAAGGLLSMAVLLGLTFLTGPSSMEQLRLDREEASNVQRETRQQKQKILDASLQKPLETKMLKVEKNIPFQNQTKTGTTLPPGKEKIVQQGKAGKKLLIYEVAYEDGKEISRKLKKEIWIEKPVAQITLLGAIRKPAYGSVGSNDTSEPSKKSDGNCKSFFSSILAKLSGNRCST